MQQINISEFSEAVLKMRKFQKQYERTKDYLCFQAQQKAEKEVDKFLEVYEKGKAKTPVAQQALFD